MLSRPKLIRRVAAALRVNHALIVAPAGYGKSTLLRSLAAQRDGTFHIRLTQADGDPALLASRLEPHAQAGATLLLDDVHHLDGAQESLAWLDTQLRSTQEVRYVLCGRSAPVAAWTETCAAFDASDLAFSDTEAAALLSDSLGLTPQAIAQWQARTRGWPLALSVLARQLRDASDASRSRLLDSVANLNDDELLGHLAERMIRLLPRDLLAYLQATALPHYFTDALAAQLLGISNGQAANLRAEAQRRNLFLEPAEQSGAYRYHDLVREYLFARRRRLNPAELQRDLERVSEWFEAQGDVPNAIEHALLARAHARAAGLLTHKLDGNWVWDSGRYHTYKRWVLGLPREIQARHPLLLARLGRYLIEAGATQEAHAHISAALTSAQEQADSTVLAYARSVEAVRLRRQGLLHEAIALLRETLRDPGITPKTRVVLLNTLANGLVESHRLSEARPIYHQALALAVELGDALNVSQVRDNLAFLVHQPLGQFDAARRLLLENDDYVRGKPTMAAAHLLAWAGLHEQLGDWPAVGSTLDAIARADAESEQSSDDKVWEWWYDAMRHIGAGNFAAAPKLLDDMRAHANARVEVLACEAWAWAWLFRKQGRLQACVDFADERMPEFGDAPLYQAALGFERAFAAHMLGQAWIDAAQTSLRFHARLRARPFLMRWRALLALACHQSGDARWRRHASAALRLCATPDSPRVLIARETELGARFWALCVAEGVASAEALAALREIGDARALLRWLSAPRQDSGASHVLPRIAAALAELGDESAITPLAELLDGATLSDMERMALDRALAVLENARPPILRVRLMGGFDAWRDESPIAEDAWTRPAARKLCAYFALQAGVPLRRDQIIDDLWPDSDPQAARGSLKTTLSWMRKAIEPHLRAKSPARYYSANAEVYVFGAGPDILESDVARFERVVRGALDEADAHDVLPVSAELTAQLLGYKVLLPEYQYEEWTVGAREKLLDLYVKGCLYVAQARLNIGQYVDSANWAERAIAAAPWLEEAYQSLMRAQARQGQRALALKTYAACVAALQRELGVPPAPLSGWLAKRLERGEEI